MQMFRADRYVGLLEFWLKEVKRWSSSKETLGRICDWNDIVSLAIAIEPVHYPLIASSYVIRGFVSEAQYQAVIDTHHQDLRAILGQLSRDQVEAMRRELCIDADRLDRNRHIYTLLRLGGHESRDKLRGKIGGATMLREMAELLRRFYEDVHKTELPEEDELGFGWMVAGAKKKLYSSHRLFDGDQRVTMEFFQSLRLDHRVKVRWYVEGDTEWGALTSYFDAFPSARVQIINLRGRFVESKTLSFRDSLITDEKASIFSFISLDADRLDNLRVVRKAAEDDVFCGFIFVSQPDFELANFTVEELVEVAWEAATELGTPTEYRSKLDSLLSTIASGKDFLRMVIRTFPSLVHLSKGTEWGQRLLRYADSHPTMPDGSTRPILEAIREALLAEEATFLGSRENYRVDPTSGRPVRRVPVNGQ